MNKLVRSAAFCLFAASPFAVGFSADSPVSPDPAPVVERAPDADRSASAAELAALRHENTQLKADLAAAATDAAHELATLRAKVARLEKPAAQAAAEKARADEAIARLDTLTPALEKLQQEKATLEARLAGSGELEAKLAEARQRVATLQADNDLFKVASADHARLTAELEKVRQEKAAALPSPDLSAKLAETGEQLATALRSFSVLQTENDRLKAAATDHAALAAELEKTRVEKDALAARLAAVPPDTSAELAAKLADSENKLATALGSYSSLQVENERLKSAAAGVTDLQAEVEKLRAEKSALEARVAAPAPETPPDLSGRLADTESKLSTALRSYSLLQTENDRLKEEAARAAEQFQKLATRSSGESAARIAQLADELRQTQSQCTALATENAQLKTRFALVGPPPGSTLASPLRPGTAQAEAALPPATPNPNPEAAAAQPRSHVVVAGDNLAKLARQYYGNANRWDEILRANRDTIKNENVLSIGATLRIP